LVDRPRLLIGTWKVGRYPADRENPGQPGAASDSIRHRGCMYRGKLIPEDHCFAEAKDRPVPVRCLKGEPGHPP